MNIFIASVIIAIVSAKALDTTMSGLLTSSQMVFPKNAASLYTPLPYIQMCQGKPKETCRFAHIACKFDDGQCKFSYLMPGFSEIGMFAKADEICNLNTSMEDCMGDPRASFRQTYYCEWEPKQKKCTRAWRHVTSHDVLKGSNAASI